MDTVMYFYPCRAAVARQVSQGLAPLWTSSVCGGMPLLANPQTGAFYPPNWLFFLFPKAGMFTLLFALHIALGAVGIYFWLRAKRMSSLCSIGAALIAMLSGATWAHLAFGAYLNVMALFPWMLFFLERFRQKPRGGRFLAIGLVAALQILAGAPQAAYYCFLVYIVLGISFIFKTGEKKQGIRNSILLFIALILGLGIAAVQLAGARELIRFSHRTGSLPLSAIKTGSLSFKRILLNLT